MLSYSKQACKTASKQAARPIMANKALLQYLMLLAPDPDFPELWARILQVLQVLSFHLCFVIFWFGWYSTSLEWGFLM